MLKKKDVVYYTKIIPGCGIYDVYELRIRTVEDDWFVGLEKTDKQAHYFTKSDIGKTIFKDRNEALNVVRKAEKNKKNVKKTPVHIMKSNKRKMKCVSNLN